MVRHLAAAVVVAVAVGPASAGVIVFANYTPADVTLTYKEAGGAPRAVRLTPFQTLPVRVSGPVEATYPTRDRPDTLHLEPNNAYAVIPDEKAGRRIEGIGLPGRAPESDAKPEGKPQPEGPVRVPVTLMVDDIDPRADRLWQATLRQRFQEAAGVVEAHSGVRFEFAGFGTWKSDPDAPTLDLLLEDFEGKVKVKPGQVAVGYTSRKFGDAEKDMTQFGATRGAGGRHLLVREWKPRNETERMEVLVHHLGLLLGAVPSPDEVSVMRPKLGDGKAISPRFRIRFDPLNALAMSLWADELRRGAVGRVSDATADNLVRLSRIYNGFAHVMPGDPRITGYVNELDNALGRLNPKPDVPKKPADPLAMAPKKGDAPPPADPVEPKPPAPPPLSPQEAAVRDVVAAVRRRAEANARRPAEAVPGEPARLGGDDLTAAYLAAAGEAAARQDQSVQVYSFLVGLGLALDDAGVLRDHPLTGPLARQVETDGERRERLTVLGTPTLRSRRDLLQRFAAAVALAEHVGPGDAERDGVARAVADLKGPAGLSFARVAAGLAGVEFAGRVKAGIDRASALTAGRGRPAAVLPPTLGLREGLSEEKFGADYGSPSDPRFKAAVEQVRGRVAAVPAYGK